MQFSINNKALKPIPENWQQLRIRHFPALHQMIQTITQTSQILAMDAAMLFCAWAKLPLSYASLPQIFNNRKIQALTAFTEFILHEKPLIRIVFPFFGPTALLKNFTYLEYLYTEQCYRQWISGEEDDQTWLNNFLGACWRPRLIPFSPRRVEFWAYLISFLPYALRLKMAYSFIGQRNHLPALYKELYGGKKSRYELRIDQQVLNLTGPELGNFHQVSKAPLHRVLELLQLRAIENSNKPQTYGSNHTVEELYKAAGYKHVPSWAADN